MNISQIKLLLKQPLPIIIKKVRSLAFEKIIHHWWSISYTSKDYRNPPLKRDYSYNFGLSNIQELNSNKINKETERYLVNMYLNHRFDLLGSGWIKNSYHSIAPGIEGIKFENTLQHLNIDKEGIWLNEIVHKNHLAYSKNIWSIIINENTNYKPIDWQKDYKSGFRFNSKDSYLHQSQLVQADGIDLKIPWELGRLQHLPQLAIFYKNNPDSIEIIREFKCQLLDFIMTNPIGMGVNWSCTMDVGIRAANICLAYNWFKQLDSHKILDQEFDQIVLNFIYSHGVHTFNNFEYKEGLTSNHYLGNIAGLTYISCYLENSKEIDFWLAYAIQELSKELKKQFFNDGSNFEGSTAYHRLSGEMMVYCFSLLHRISNERLISLSKINSKNFRIKADFNQKKFTSKEFFSTSVIDSIYKMAEFTLAYTKPNGEITQVGDNDSGRFFRLSPCGDFLKIDDAFKKYSNLVKTEDYQELTYWDENNINHSSFLSAINGLFDSPTLLKFSNKFPLEYQLIKNLSAFKYKASDSLELGSLNKTFDKLEFSKSFKLSIDIDTNTLIAHSFLDFGFTSIKNDNFYFSISFGANKKSHHSWGHQHNDKTAIELQLNSRNILFDSGTYIYTPLPEKRNKFRSSFIHNSIIVDSQEQNNFNKTRRGLFTIDSDCKTSLINISTTQVVVKVETNNYIHYREVIITNNKFIVTDYCNKPFEQNFNLPLFSNGYGKLIIL